MKSFTLFQRLLNKMSLSYRFTDCDLTPSVITRNSFSTPVWIQQKWCEGEYAEFIQKNGCGHCCITMALNLHGINIDPHEEFALCRSLWGIPREAALDEGNFVSTSGIVKILNHFGIKGECFGVPIHKSDEAAMNIENALKSGKSVIMWSHPSKRLPANPFSPGEHYVYLVGICDDGNILVANSSIRSEATNGIQFTNRDTIEKVLMEGCQPLDFTWGRFDLYHSSGYVTVG